MGSTKELMGASTDLLVLAILARAADYGYRIVRRINDESDGQFRWREGTIYPILHKLEKEGRVETEWQIAETGRRRKYYHITESGREALAEQREAWQTVNALVSRLTEAPNV